MAQCLDPYCPPNMDITGMKESDFKIIPVDEQVAQQMRDITLEEISQRYGMSDPNRDPVSDLIKSYYPRVAVKDRVHAAHTLEKTHPNEVCKIFDFIRSRVPGWQAGQHFDRRILEDERRQHKKRWQPRN